MIARLGKDKKCLLLTWGQFSFLLPCSFAPSIVAMGWTRRGSSNAVLEQLGVTVEIYAFLESLKLNMFLSGLLQRPWRVKTLKRSGACSERGIHVSCVHV